MNKIIVTLAAVLLVNITSAQSKVKTFTFQGNVLELNLMDSTEKGVMGIPIEIWSGEELVATEMSGPKGKYSINLPRYSTFTLKFGKAPYVTKVVEIDTKGFERAADLAIVNLELDISLFKDRGYLGMNFMNYTPVAMAKFNKRSGKLEWNMDYAKDVNDRLTGVLTANGK
ncbi:MAG: hypothetical protein ACK478_10695 [Flavobacteriales bacterium]|jgi:hypothetical protein